MTEPTKERVERAWQIVNEYEETCSHLRGRYTRANLLSIVKLAAVAFAQAESQDYEEVLADKRRLIRKLDVIWNGEGAAKQASLCDIVAQIEDELPKLRAAFAQAEDGGQCDQP